MNARPPAASRLCACGTVFAYDSGFYRSRSLRPPRSCPGCRSNRKARLQSRVGEVVKLLGGDGGVEVESAGEKFIAWPRDGREVHVGDQLAFEVDPQEEPAAGRLRVARQVKRLGITSVSPHGR